MNNTRVHLEEILRSYYEILTVAFFGVIQSLHVKPKLRRGITWLCRNLDIKILRKHALLVLSVSYLCISVHMSCLWRVCPCYCKFGEYEILVEYPSQGFLMNLSYRKMLPVLPVRVSLRHVDAHHLHCHREPLRVVARRTSSLQKVGKYPDTLSCTL